MLSSSELKQFYKETAEELNIPVDLVKEVYEFKCKWLRENLKSRKYFQILDTGHGTYIRNFRELNRTISFLLARRAKGLPVGNQILDKLYKEKKELHQFNIKRRRKQKNRDLCTA